MKKKISIITWDCCFRNFYHTVDSILPQSRDDNDLEIIIVEQRTRQQSFDYHKEWNTIPPEKLYEEEDICRVIYMDEEDSVYHWGRALNVGILHANGEVIATMDADMLLRDDFIESLLSQPDLERRVFNLHRLMATKPVGASKGHWIEGSFEYDLVGRVSGLGQFEWSRFVSNKAPMICAHRDYWQQIGGYDDADFWSKGSSLSGLDVTARLEAVAGRLSEALPGQVSLHPWHPEGFSRTLITALAVYEIQSYFIEWSLYSGKLKSADRKEHPLISKSSARVAYLRSEADTINRKFKAYYYLLLFRIRRALMRPRVLSLRKKNNIALLDA